MIEPKQKAQACIIWMHGLGASADDMTGLAKQLPLNVPVRHVALDAPTRPVTFNQGMVMPAWYDVKGFTLEDKEDKPGILASKQIILAAIQTQIADGFSPETIFLAGFSQGGAMALFTALHTELALGGVIVLSAYLPLASECKPKLNRKTPMFIASGVHDQILLPAWTEISVTWLRDQGFDALTVRDYPMEHSVCLEEVQALGVWFEQQMTVIQSVAGEI
ncbi:MAG: carboxylesterase [Gammaproteobacteria bacterium]|nr:carboxylesterase [Gammaproteobacteria bacterium]MCH9717550.1 carboxylesterase [Gammaproteobacteria bacterium]MCH9764102.1 carboxylesterase [Gammaproteobacteria bacterium]